MHVYILQIGTGCQISPQQINVILQWLNAGKTDVG